MSVQDADLDVLSVTPLDTRAWPRLFWKVIELGLGVLAQISVDLVAELPTELEEGEDAMLHKRHFVGTASIWAAERARSACEILSVSPHGR